MSILSPQWATLESAAAMLGVSVSRVRQLVKEMKLRTVYVGPVISSKDYKKLRARNRKPGPNSSLGYIAQFQAQPQESRLRQQFAGVRKKVLPLITERCAGRCAYCGTNKPGKPGRSKVEQWCLDHVISLSRGGSNDARNLVLACFKCNASKNSKDVEQFRDWHFRGKRGERIFHFEKVTGKQMRGRLFTDADRAAQEWAKKG